MGKLLTAFTIAASLVLPAEAQNAESDADQQAQEIADILRNFNEILGDVVDGELTDKQIDAFEHAITPAFNIDDQHQTFCNMAAFVSAMKAGSIIHADVMAASTSDPESLEILAGTKADIEESIVPGSMDDWLFQLSLPLAMKVGLERTVAAGTHECLQHHMAHAMSPSTPMNSEEMRYEEKCQAEIICP